MLGHMNYYYNLFDAFQESLRDNHKLTALTDYSGGESISYLELAAEIARMHILFESLGVSAGDRIILLGGNNSKCVTSYVGALTYGAVVVPVGYNTATETIAAIIRRTGAKLVFANSESWKNCSSDDELKNCTDVLDIDSLKPLADCSGKLANAIAVCNESFVRKYPSFNAEDINYHHVESDEVAVICYREDDKGLLQEDAFTVNRLTNAVQSVTEKYYPKKGSRSLVLLPLTDVSTCVFDMMAPLAAGSHITLLGENPDYSLIRKALKRVKPDFICTVPVFMERIVRKRIFPKLNSKFVQACLRTPVINKMVYNSIRRRMMFLLGGKVKEVKVKGKQLAPEVQDILLKIKFPFNFSVI